MVFTFGPTGSFGYASAAPASSNKLGWWSNWGERPIPSSNILPTEEIRAQLRYRHGDWHDPVIQQVIETMETDRIYPIWTTPALPCWGPRGAVLLGDAAHTFQATSGQGAGQALEDSVTFSLLLGHYLNAAKKYGERGEDGDVEKEEGDEASDEDDEERAREAIDKATKALYGIRSPRVALIRDRAKNLYLTDRRIDSVVLEYLYYLFIFVVIRFPVVGKSPLLLLLRWQKGLKEDPGVDCAGHLIIGNVFKEPKEWNSEEEVRRYVESERERG